MDSDACRNKGWLRDFVLLPVVFLFSTQLSVAVEIDASTWANCSVDNQGSAVCWGSTQSSDEVYAIEPQLQGGRGEWLSMSAGTEHICGVKKNNTLWCKGVNSVGQAGQPVDPQGNAAIILDYTQVGASSEWTKVFSAASLSCALKRDQSLWCWGFNHVGQLGHGRYVNTHEPIKISGSAGMKWLKVDSSFLHQCGLTDDGKAWCWGLNYGNLGDGSNNANKPIPTQVKNDGPAWVDIAAGWHISCGVKLDRSLWCWGIGSGYGLLGDPDAYAVTEPQQFHADKSWLQVSVEDGYACGLTDAGEIYCWGRNGVSQAGDAPPHFGAQLRKIGNDSGWQTLDLGRHHGCATKNNGVYCWGLKGQGAIGNDAKPWPEIPTSLASATNWLDVDGGVSHTCAIASDGHLSCRGANGSGQNGFLQHLIFDAFHAPVSPVNSGSQRWQAVSSGSVHNCGIKNDKSLWCWGGNSQGQLGIGSNANVTLSPTQVLAGASWREVSSYANHTCAISNDRNIWCWGDNQFSAVGDGTTTNRRVPVLISDTEDWQQVSVGAEQSCALKENGSLWCWGGQPPALPVGPDTPSAQPVLINQDLDWVAVRLGGGHACAKKANGDLYCWGKGAEGQLGNGSTEDSNQPVLVAGGYHWEHFELLDAATCGIDEDQQLLCWGQNNRSELGHGNRFQHNLPTIVNEAQGAEASNWVALGGGKKHVCAIRESGALLCWGENRYEQVREYNISVPEFVDTNVYPVITFTEAPVGVTTSSSETFEFSTNDSVEYECRLDQAGVWEPCQDGQFLASNLANGHHVFEVRMKRGQHTSTPLTRVWTVEQKPVAASVDASLGHTCQVVDKVMHCWGQNPYGQVGNGGTEDSAEHHHVLPGSQWSDVATGWQNSCGIATVGQIWCWGRDVAGILGQGQSGSNAAHVPVPLRTHGTDSIDSDWAQIAIGAYHACAIKDEGSLWCWGANNFRQAAGGETNVVTRAQRVGEDQDWLAVSLGLIAGCASRTDGSLWCWGYGAASGTGETENIPVPEPIQSNQPWNDFDIGWYHGCGTQVDGSLWCWGMNPDFPETVGNTNPNLVYMPQLIDDKNLWARVGVDFASQCAVRADDHQLYCWGENGYRQAGQAIPGVARIEKPELVPGDGEQWLDVASAPNHHCVTHKDGTAISCFGSNHLGQLGQGHNETVAILRERASETLWKSLAGGDRHYCGVKGDNTLWCWGDDLPGVLAFGREQVSSEQPQQVGDGTDWQVVTSGLNHLCALKNDGQMYCWGLNDYGQLGLGDVQSRSEPTAVAEDQRWLDVASNENHTCAVRDDHTMWCWGHNSASQAGKPNPQDAERVLLPQQIVELDVNNKWLRVAVGSHHSCGTTLHQQMYCWGSNYFGQIGVGWNGGADRSQPRQVAGIGTGWVRPFASKSFSCGLRQSGELRCWGNNGHGQLGHIGFNAKATAVQGDYRWQTASLSHTGACGLTVAGELKCWGALTQHGTERIHNGTARYAPHTPTGSAVAYQHLGAAKGMQCAAKSQGGLDCWGWNTFGRVAEGSIGQPAQVVITAPVADTQPPQTTLFERPEQQSSSQTAVFTFTANEPASYRCRWYSNSDGWTEWADNCQSPIIVANLPDGDYQLELQAVDRAGNVEQPVINWQWQIVADPINTTITRVPDKGNNGIANIDSDYFEFEASMANASFECRLNDGNGWSDWQACSSPYTYQNVDDGLREFEVRAVRQDGWKDPSPARHLWLLDKIWLAVGSNHSCLIDRYSALHCWGVNGSGQLGDGTVLSKDQPVAVANSEDWQAVAVGGMHSCAIHDEGTLWCWGNNDAGQLGLGDAALGQVSDVPQQVGTASDWFAVDAGAMSTCAIRDYDNGGNLWCWGDNSLKQLGADPQQGEIVSSPQQVGGSPNWHQLSLGDHHACALYGNRKLRCWGDASKGQLGHNGYDSRGYLDLYEDSQIENVVSGAEHSCALYKPLLSNDPEIYCWGDNRYGQLGDGTTQNSPQKNAVTVNPSDQYKRWISLVAGPHNTCALLDTENDGFSLGNKIYCWGRNDFGQLGLGHNNPVLTPTEVGHSAAWRLLALGERHSCAVNRNQQLYCWGQIHGRTVPVSNTENHPQLVQVQGFRAEQGFGKQTAGLDHSCTIAEDNTIWCWGENQWGALGGQLGLSKTDATAVAEPATAEWKKLSAGHEHICALRDDTSNASSTDAVELHCWGQDTYKRLAGSSPTQVMAKPSKSVTHVFDSWRDVAAGSRHNCAIARYRNSSQNLRFENHITCWGDNRYGQLGNGQTAAAAQDPVFVDSAKIDWEWVASGDSHSCAIDAADALYCWGDNQHGQLATGDLNARQSPTQVGQGHKWRRIYAQGDRSCAITNDRQLYCWGASEADQLALTPASQANLPIPFTQQDWLHVSLADSHSCGIRNFDELWCWAGNTWGQIGEAATDHVNVPRRLFAEHPWESVTAGSKHSCAMTRTGQLYCFGNDYNGQLGSGKAWAQQPQLQAWPTQGGQ